MTVAIVDVGLCNAGSVANMVRKVGGDPVLVDDPDAIARADRLILPGVGAFDAAVRRLEERALIDAIRALAARGVPLLGICLGMQLLARRSEEGVLAGLDLVDGEVTRLPAIGPDGPVKVPHMGWSRLDDRAPHALLDATADDGRFYFVHSYAFRADAGADVVATAEHGGTPFVAAVARGNVAGVQFHPEKSHRHGMALMRTFLGWQP